MATDGRSGEAPLIAVVGATGNQGGAVVDALLERAARMRGLTRNTASAAAQALAARGVELVQGDLTDPDSLDALFSGVDAAFLMTAMTGDMNGEVSNGVAGAEAAVRNGVPHLLQSSVGGAERHSGLPHFASKRRVEEHIESLGIHHTFLRPCTSWITSSAPA